MQSMKQLGRGQETQRGEMERQTETEKQIQTDKQMAGAQPETPLEPSAPSPLTHRSHPSLSSAHRCPSLRAGVGEAGGGHRAQGLLVLRALPPGSQPGLQCCPRCLGRGAAHRTGGGERGEPQGGVSASQKPPYPGTQEMALPCPSVPQVFGSAALDPSFHAAVWVGLRALSLGFLLYSWPVKSVPSEIPDVWAGGSRGGRLTQVWAVRVRDGLAKASSPQ